VSAALPDPTRCTIRELEELTLARILALDGTPYNQGTTIRGAWREAEIPLSVADEAHPLGHLLVNVFAESGRNRGMERDQAGRFLAVASDLVILFTYHLRRGTQLEDARQAADAAHDVARALLAWPSRRVVVDLVNLWRPTLTPDGEWLLVRQDYVARFDLSI